MAEPGFELLHQNAKSTSFAIIPVRSQTFQHEVPKQSELSLGSGSF